MFLCFLMHLYLLLVRIIVEYISNGDSTICRSDLTFYIHFNCFSPNNYPNRRVLSHEQLESFPFCSTTTREFQCVPTVYLSCAIEPPGRFFSPVVSFPLLPSRRAAHGFSHSRPLLPLSTVFYSHVVRNRENSENIVMLKY